MASICLSLWIAARQARAELGTWSRGVCTDTDLIGISMRLNPERGKFFGRKLVHIVWHVDVNYVIY